VGVESGADPKTQDGRVDGMVAEALASLSGRRAPRRARELLGGKQRFGQREVVRIRDLEVDAAAHDGTRPQAERLTACDSPVAASASGRASASPSAR